MFSGHWSRPSAMFGPSYGELALRRVWNHRTQLFANEFNVSQEYAAHIFNVRRDAVSLHFQVHRFKMPVEAGLIAFSNACFEFADDGPEEAQNGSVAILPAISTSHWHFEGCWCEFCA